MFRSSPEKLRIINGRRRMILIILATLCAQVTGFCPRNGMCISRVAPRIGGLSPPSSLTAASRRRYFLLFGKSTTFESKEQNATGVTMFETELSNVTYDAAIEDAQSSSPSSRASLSLPNPTLPLNDVQLAALRRGIPKFIIPIKSVHGNGWASGQFVVLWRSLVDDSPELAGFPISFLVEQAQSLDVSYSLSTSKTLPTKPRETIDNKIIDWGRVLPYIDAYQFESGGGLSGLVYGIAGVSDGTRVRTTPVGDVQTTLPRNFVQTADGCFYELGKPSFVEDSDYLPYSVSGTSKRWYRNGSEIASSMVAKTTNGDNFSSGPVDADILQLSALTALVLGGSYVLGTLSHHLTVNVFWV
jgi:hypothetical protein